MAQTATMAPSRAPDQEWITVAEAADCLRVTRRTIYNWISAERLPAKRFGGIWRIDRRAVQATSVSFKK